MLIITPIPKTTEERKFIMSYVKSFVPIKEMVRSKIKDDNAYAREIEDWNESENKNPLFWCYYPSWEKFDHINYQAHILE